MMQSEIPRPNWLEIDLNSLQSNIKYVKSLLPANVKLLLPVKADAYGHGAYAISNAAVKAGVDFLGVAHLFEGIALREKGIEARILILGPCLEKEFSFLQKYNLTPSIQNYEMAKKLPDCIKVHVKVDTGMHRFGIKYNNFDEIKKICELPNLEVEGMYSHLATADSPEPSAMEKQLERFDELVKKTEKAGIRPQICHIANSSATLLYTNKTHYDMVRPGIALYGYDPVGNYPSKFPIKPLLKLMSTVRALRKVEAGEGISYGHFFKAEKEMSVATIAIGYGDGYLRGEPSKGVIFIRGKACPILGRVCMDACMVDVSSVPDIEIGDVAVCIDGKLSEKISVEAFAAEHKTISYEITTRMARRLHKVYC